MVSRTLTYFFFLFNYKINAIQFCIPILVVFLITDLKLFRFSIRPNHLDDITPKMGVFRESIILSSQVLVNNQRV